MFFKKSVRQGLTGQFSLNSRLIQIISYSFFCLLRIRTSMERCVKLPCDHLHNNIAIYFKDSFLKKSLFGSLSLMSVFKMTLKQERSSETHQVPMWPKILKRLQKRNLMHINYAPWINNSQLVLDLVCFLKYLVSKPRRYCWDNTFKTFLKKFS